MPFARVQRSIIEVCAAASGSLQKKKKKKICRAIFGRAARSKVLKPWTPAIVKHTRKKEEREGRKETSAENMGLGPTRKLQVHFELSFYFSDCQSASVEGSLRARSESLRWPVGKFV